MLNDADLEKSLDWFGGKNTQRGILLFIVRHASEHLGQSIAYARFAGVTPPWTEDMQKKQPEKSPQGRSCWPFTTRGHHLLVLPVPSRRVN
jgi:uncharacterized damage-inducible protein DinB